MGGYRTHTGYSIKWHKFLRSAYLNDLTALELDYLYNYGIRVVIDLRSPSETTTFPDVLDSRFRYLKIPVFTTDWTASNSNSQDIRTNFSQNPQAGYLRMLQVYRRLIITSESQAAYRKFLAILLANAGKAGILFHCSAGKDRTGFAAILILNLLGVSEATIQSDYLLTNAASQKRINQRLQDVRAHHMSACYQNSIYDLSTVKFDYYEQALSLINYEYGGMRTYLREVLQISQQQHQELQQHYLLKL